MTSEPAVGGTKPVLVQFAKAGDSSFWCACGRSATQPYCDGSHRGTGFTPLRIVARRDGEEALLCACKRTRTPPYCDGSHNALRSGAAAESVDWRTAKEAQRDPAGRADLDGGCFVLTPGAGGEEFAGWRVFPAITPAGGSDRLSQYLLRPIAGQTEPLNFGASEAVLFVASGEAEILVGRMRFRAPTHAALSLRPGESFAATAADAADLLLVATVCPPAAPAVGPASAFDERFPRRVEVSDSLQRIAAGDRFYQTLASERTGAGEITQFIGGVPLSRAEGHRHLYEEAIIILAGSGVMWTDRTKAPVAAGDIIYLPRKQLHSLECVSPEGMVLAGSFFPAGSPAVNY